jgi:hypothetical protein
MLCSAVNATYLATIDSSWPVISTVQVLPNCCMQVIDTDLFLFSFFQRGSKRSDMGLSPSDEVTKTSLTIFSTVPSCEFENLSR